jgi:hypothetical protein
MLSPDVGRGTRILAVVTIAWLPSDAVDCPMNRFKSICRGHTCVQGIAKVNRTGISGEQLM